MVYLHSNFSGGLCNCIDFFPQECVSAVQGHPRSLILVPIESAHETFYQSVIATLVLSCTVSEILQFYAHDPTPILPSFWGCSRFTRSPIWGSMWAGTLS